MSPRRKMHEISPRNWRTVTALAQSRAETVKAEETYEQACPQLLLARPVAEAFEPVTADRLQFIAAQS